MASWAIYKKNGEPRLDKNNNPVVVHSLEYNGTWMGECFVTVDIKSPYPIPFAVGDYLEYRGDIFVINYDPTVIKKASRGTYGEGFTYSGIKMNSASDELTRCSFLDYTINDNVIHYSSLPEYNFYAESVIDLANRLVANLNRVYPNAWEVRVVCEKNTYSTKTGGSILLGEIPGEKNLDIAVNNNYCWDALALVRSQFKLNFIIRGRVIIVNPPAIASNALMYGKGNGLKEIGRSSDSSQQIITRLRAYGSEKNMPWRYYANLPGETPIQQNNLAVKRLMLPGFPDNQDPYLSKNEELYGVREASVYFDKDDPENDIYEVYPTIEEMMAKDANVAPFDDTRLDEIVDWRNKLNPSATDEGYRTGYWDPKVYEQVPNFTLNIRHFGLDMKEALTKNSYKIVMKDGMCGSRDFPVVSATEVTLDKESFWTLECNRCNDQSLDIWFPCELYPLNFGENIKDHFVIEDIELPDVYIQAASNKLQRYAQAYLDNNCSTKYAYNPTIDNIWMARQHDSAPEGTSLHDTLKEGCVMAINDDDLGIELEKITIDQLTIKEGISLIPEYNIVLREKKEVGTIQKIQNQIESIRTNGVGGGGGISSSEMRVLGSSLFLSKKNDDTAEGNIKFRKDVTSEDFQSGSFGYGFGMYKDAEGGSHMETDYLDVRRSAFFRVLTIAEVKHIGGELILSAAASQISKVEQKVLETESGKVRVHRCYFDTTANGKTVYNEWMVGDQAYCRTFKPYEATEDVGDDTVMNTIRYYWRLVVGVGEDYVDLSVDTRATGSDTPAVNDNIVLLGSRGQDAYRKSAQVYSTANGTAPSRIYYAGIDSFSLEGKAVEVMENNQHGAHWRVGDSNSYVDYNNRSLSIKVNELKIGTTDVGGALGDKFETFIDDEHNAPVDVNGNIIEKMLFNAYEQLPSYNWTFEECGTNLGSFYLTKDGISYKFVLEDSLYYWVMVADKYLVDAMNKATENATILTNMGDDNVVTLQEKTTISTIWEGVKSEYDNTISSASLYSGNQNVQTALSQYTSGFSALEAVMNMLLITESGEDSPLVDADGEERTFTYFIGLRPYGTTYKMAWDNYYRRKALLDFATTGATIEMIDNIAIEEGGYDEAVKNRLTALESEYGELSGAWQGFSSTEFYNYIRYGTPGGTYSGTLLTTANFSAMTNKLVDKDGNEYQALIGTYIEGKDGVYVSGAKMEADKIDLEGKTMTFTGNQITINTDNFKLDENGNVDIKGIVEAKVFYSPAMVLSNQNYTINTVASPYSDYLLLNYDIPSGSTPGTRTILLPQASQYKGIELSFFLYKNDTNYHNVILEARNGDEIHFANGLYMSVVSKARIAPNKEIRIKSFGDRWIVLQGEVQEFIG